MLIQIDFQSEMPIYLQIKKQIVQGIAKRQLEEGESLPSVRQMAEDLGVNLHTVNKAYTLLKNEGFVMMDRRKGAVVNSSSAVASEEYLFELNEEIEYMIGEAHCRGVSKEEFIKIIEQTYKRFEEKG